MNFDVPDEELDWFSTKSSKKEPEPAKIPPRTFVFNKIRKPLPSVKPIEFLKNQDRKPKFIPPKPPLLSKIGPDNKRLTFGEEIEIAKKRHQALNLNTTSVSEQPPVIDEYDEADFGDTYDDYKPAKLKLGVKHPDSVVESSSLSVVNPPDIIYEIQLPPDVITTGKLSALQLESVIYACQKHQSVLANQYRAGYLIGDGPGVGKGRIISGIIYENMLHQRTRALWVSVSSDLRFDAQNDLEDIGCYVNVKSLQKLSYNDKIEELFEEFNDIGVLFSTYSSLIGESHSDTTFKTRYDQIIDWLGPNSDNVIIFDECHKAKNLKPSGNSKPTKTALTVLKLQNDLPRARIVYCSATGASEPRNMAYMTRLGLWGTGTPFPDFEHFLSSVEKRGVGAMELIAIDMKQRGVYLARQLSFTGVSFNIQEIPLTESFVKIYDSCVVFWDKALSYFEKAADLINITSRDRTFMMAQFFASHQRFFKALCIASKVDEVVRMSKIALAENKAVVIGLQSTGEAMSLQLIKNCELETITSTLYGIILNLVNKQFPRLGVSVDEEGSNKRKYDEEPIRFDKYRTDKNLCQTIENMEHELLVDVDRLRDVLPPNTLDELIDKLGGVDNVAEMTGRKGRIVRTGRFFSYQSRSNEETSLELANVYERDMFMQGRKLVAIISEAASSGISLQSDKRVTNTRKRLHITLELSWSADRAIQQFGRTHRSNQLSPPEYIFAISELAGEKRFACVVAKRIESLGALTHGDRRAGEARDLSQFNIDTKYGRIALEKMIAYFHTNTQIDIPLPDYNGDFLTDARNIASRLFKMENTRSNDSKDSSPKIHKFLNRLLGVKVALQNAIYEFYTTILDNCIKDAKGSGKYDFGIVDFGIGSETVVENSKARFQIRASSGTMNVEIVAFAVERGLSFEHALSMLDKNTDKYVGFYSAKDGRAKGRQMILVLKDPKNANDKLYTVSRPNTGFGLRSENIDKIIKMYNKVNNPATIRSEWSRFFEASGYMCLHKYLNGSCKTEERLGICDVGKRIRNIYLFCGAIFSTWNIIEETFGQSPIRMARVVTKDKTRRIGIMIPSSYIPNITNLLNRMRLGGG